MIPYVRWGVGGSWLPPLGARAPPWREHSLATCTCVYPRRAFRAVLCWPSAMLLTCRAVAMTRKTWQLRRCGDISRMGGCGGRGRVCVCVCVCALPCCTMSCLLGPASRLEAFSPAGSHCQWQPQASRQNLALALACLYTYTALPAAKAQCLLTWPHAQIAPSSQLPACTRKCKHLIRPVTAYALRPPHSH